MVEILNRQGRPNPQARSHLSVVAPGIRPRPVVGKFAGDNAALASLPAARRWGRDMARQSCLQAAVWSLMWPGHATSHEQRGAALSLVRDAVLFTIDQIAAASGRTSCESFR